MKGKLMLFPLLAILGMGLVSGSFAKQNQKSRDKVIYGKDDRVNLYQVSDERLLKLADSTVALFRSVNIDAVTGMAQLPTKPYGTGMNLCTDEPFYNEVNGAFCSGSLVGPDTIMTAGHCVKTAADCLNTKFVFGYGIKTPVSNPSSVPATEVYSCTQLLGRDQQGAGPDWALIKLDRVVANHEVLKMNVADTLKKGDQLFVIGHPAGLPTKIAGGATVRDASPTGFFVANLDTYGGNSGSAVFNAVTGLVEGILVRGENDYVYRGSCKISNVCADDACRGEDVTKLTSVFSSIVVDPVPGPVVDPVVAPINPAVSFSLMQDLGLN